MSHPEKSRPSVYSNALFNAKLVEPHKRNRDGVKWIVHRFPIKGGISIKDAMIYDMLFAENPLLKMVRSCRQEFSRRS